MDTLHVAPLGSKRISEAALVRWLGQRKGRQQRKQAVVTRMLTEAGDGKGRSFPKLFAVQAVQPGRRQTAHVDGVRQVPLRASSERERAHAAAKARSETWDPDFQYYYLPLSAVTPVSTSLPRQDRTNTWHGALQSIFGRPSHGSCGLIPIPCSLYSACRWALASVRVRGLSGGMFPWSSAGRPREDMRGWGGGLASLHRDE